MRPTPHFAWFCSIFLSACMVLAGCGPSAEAQSTQTATAQTATAASWTFTPTLTPTVTDTPTLTPTPTDTPTSTQTPTPTQTPTSTLTLTSTPTETFTPSPTKSYPVFTVHQAAQACLYGPSKEYMWAWDLKAGDTGKVIARAPIGDWLYVVWDNMVSGMNTKIYCWVYPYVGDVVGDPKSVGIGDVESRMPIANNLYKPPTGIRAVRNGDQVTITWSPVWMTQDDDLGYFLELWVCQGGSLVWVVVNRSLPNQYSTQFSVTDELGCSEQSHGEIRTAEKHGYTDAVPIPWPSK